MTTKTALIDRQLSWAAKAGFVPDSRAYLPAVESNLFQSLSAEATASFERGSGSELLDTPTRPAKMKALHSSSALAVNVFDYWNTTDPQPLAQALGIDSRITAIQFEAQFPTGLGGNPPNLDVVLQLASGDLYAIESKFSEWLRPKQANKQPFKDKYFAGGAVLWSERGLPACQRLAEQMQTEQASFRYLDAPQLLKHALGLATHPDERFSLHYIYYDWPGSESEEHLAEIGRFAGALDGRLGFTAVSYQQLYARLCEQTGSEHAEYLRYLDERYFPLR